MCIEIYAWKDTEDESDCDVCCNDQCIGPAFAKVWFLTEFDGAEGEKTEEGAGTAYGSLIVAREIAA